MHTGLFFFFPKGTLEKSRKLWTEMKVMRRINRKITTRKYSKKLVSPSVRISQRWIFPLFPLTFSLIYQSTHTKKKWSTPSNTRAHRAHKYYTPSHWSPRLGRCHSCGIYHQLSSGRTGRREASHLFHTPASGTLSPGKQEALQSQQQTYVVLLLLLFHNDLLLLWCLNHVTHRRRIKL